VTITVAGRPAAVLGPVSPRAWRRWDDLADIFVGPADDDWFVGPADDDWVADRDLLDGTLADPWAER
jgi:hypothetical protein